MDFKDLMDEYYVNFDAKIRRFDNGFYIYRTAVDPEKRRFVHIMEFYCKSFTTLRIMIAEIFEMDIDYATFNVSILNKNNGNVSKILNRLGSTVYSSVDGYEFHTIFKQGFKYGRITGRATTNT